MPTGKITRLIGLPEVTFSKAIGTSKMGHLVLIGEKTRANHEVCPRCAKPSKTVYDHRLVTLKDEPIRGVSVKLKLRKRRYLCHHCKKVFTEPIPGVLPRNRTTQRYKHSLLWACQNFSDLKRVQKAYRCSSSFLYKTLYRGLQQRIRAQINYPWPKAIGIDEHFFSRSYGRSSFATVVVDMKNKRLRAVALGKDRQSLHHQFQDIPGRENVQWAVCDLSDTYKGFIFQHFPNAQVVADKFHVLRLLHPHIIKKRKQINSTRMDVRAKRLLTMSAKKLDYFDRRIIWNYLKDHPELLELYQWKERLFGFYRIKGYARAKKALTHMLEEMKTSKLEEIKRLRRTLKRWAEEVLNYFRTGLTNARTEGFNNVAKLVQKRAYGYRNFENYKARLLNACGASAF